jgi:hypothetical protein
MTKRIPVWVECALYYQTEKKRTENGRFFFASIDWNLMKFAQNFLNNCYYGNSIKALSSAIIGGANSAHESQFNRSFPANDFPLPSNSTRKCVGFFFSQIKKKVWLLKLTGNK